MLMIKKKVNSEESSKLILDKCVGNSYGISFLYGAFIVGTSNKGFLVRTSIGVEDSANEGITFVGDIFAIKAAVGPDGMVQVGRPSNVIIGSNRKNIDGI